LCGPVEVQFTLCYANGFQFPVTTVNSPKLFHPYPSPLQPSFPDRTLPFSFSLAQRQHCFDLVVCWSPSLPLLSYFGHRQRHTAAHRTTPLASLFLSLTVVSPTRFQTFHHFCVRTVRGTL